MPKRKPICFRGHPYTLNPAGTQVCKICQKMNDAKKYERNRELSIERNRRWKLKNPGAERRVRLKRCYGITPEQFDKMMEVQGGVCAICKKPPREGHRLHVEHCHTTKRVRGLACWVCNRHRLGRARDQDWGLYLVIAEYLRSSFDGRNL